MRAIATRRTLWRLRSAGIDGHVALGREDKAQAAVDPDTRPATHRMGDKLATAEGRAQYAERKWLSEAPNGWIKDERRTDRRPVLRQAEIRGAGCCGRVMPNWCSSGSCSLFGRVWRGRTRCRPSVALGPLVTACMDNFAAEAARVPEEGPARERAIARLAQHDPAEKLLDLKVCDPAMGSGHFLVNLVDFLADCVIASMAEAEVEVEGYVSPHADRIQAIRVRIAANVAERDWAIDINRLDDRHIVRRMLLKRCVHGVDKNPDGGGTRQGSALAAHLHRRRSAELSRSPPTLRRQPVRRIRAGRD